MGKGETTDQAAGSAEPGALPGPAGLTAGSARSTLLTVVGDLAWPTGRPVWTSTLIHILGGLGIEEQTARQAIARASSSGWIRAERRGREVRWHTTPTGEQIFRSALPRVQSLNEPFTGWDGRWLTLLITIPHTHRSARKKLYSGLTWAGFGNPAPGVWLSPHPERGPEVAQLISELDLDDHTLSIVGTVDSVGISVPDIVARGWDLGALEEHYEALLREYSSLEPAAGEEMLLAYVSMVTEWQHFPRMDPQLPEAILPGWIGRRVARQIWDLRAAWAPSAKAYFEELDSRRDTE